MGQKLTHEEAAEYLAELAAAGQLRPMDENWMDSLSADPEKWPWWLASSKLDAFLQDLFPGTHAGPWVSGYRSVIPEPAVDYLIDYGEFWIDPVLWKMEDNRCHDNLQCLWENMEVDDVYIGYALSEGGMWRSHSWGVRMVPGDDTESEWEVIETTVPRLMYWGVPDPEYAEDVDPKFLRHFV